MAPCCEYVTAVMAAQSAGGAYLPIEKAYPAGLVADVCADARPAVVLTSAALEAKLRASLGARCPPTLAIDEPATLEARLEAMLGDVDLSTAALERLRLAAPAATLDDLSFFVYSSGTTGAPKGIANPHRAPALSYAWRFGLHDCGPGHRAACSVFFVWECVRPLLRGGCTVVIPPDDLLDTSALLGFLAGARATEVLLTPTLAANLLNTAEPAALAAGTASLRAVLLNGEVVSTALAKRMLAAFPQATVYNLYSISECHEVAMTRLEDYGALLDELDFCPVGVPSALTPAALLDDDLNPVPEVGRHTSSCPMECEEGGGSRGV